MLCIGAWNGMHKDTESKIEGILSTEHKITSPQDGVFLFVKDEYDYLWWIYSSRCLMTDFFMSLLFCFFFSIRRSSVGDRSSHVIRRLS